MATDRIVEIQRWCRQNGIPALLHGMSFDGVKFCYIHFFISSALACVYKCTKFKEATFTTPRLLIREDDLTLLAIRWPEVLFEPEVNED